MRSLLDSRTPCATAEDLGPRSSGSSSARGPRPEVLGILRCSSPGSSAENDDDPFCRPFPSGRPRRRGCLAFRRSSPSGSCPGKGDGSSFRLRPGFPYFSRISTSALSRLVRGESPLSRPQPGHKSKLQWRHPKKSSPSFTSVPHRSHQHPSVGASCQLIRCPFAHRRELAVPANISPRSTSGFPTLRLAACDPELRTTGRVLWPIASFRAGELFLGVTAA